MDINRSKRPKSFKRQYNNSVICNNSSNNLSSNIDKNNEQAITDIKANNSKIANGSAISINDSRNDCLSDIAPGILYTASVPNEKEFLINNDSETKHPSEVKTGQRNALIADNFSNVYIPGDTGRPLQNISVDNSKSYNDYVNKTYRDASRRQSVEKDIGIKSEEDQIVFNSIHDVISSDKSEDSSKPFLAAFERNNEKLPKSIVKSPSAQSFNKGSKLDTKARKRLSLQWSANDEVNSQTTNNIGNSNEIERPVLHVQFMAHDNGDPSEISTATASANRRRSECKSPLGSISSRSSGTSNSSSSDDDDGSSIEQYSEARAPDGGWGWVVVFASFVVNLIADGITFSFGVIFVEFLNYFGKGKAKTAWIGSLFMAIPLLSGPIASFLTDRYGCRKVTIAGSILACIGFVISSFSNSMEMLFFTFGILAGFGLSLCYVAAVVIVAYYFEKKRSFATGLSVCGSGIGTFIFAPLTQLLLEEYGWRGTTLILAGIFLNMCVCGVLMKDLEWTTHRAKLKAKERKRSKLGVSADSFSVSNSTNTGGTASNLNQTVQSADQTNTVNPIKIEDFDDPRVFSSLITLPTFVRNGEKVPVEVLELLSTHRNVHNLLIQNYPGLLHSRSFSEPFSSSGTGLSPDVTVTSDNRELPTVKESSKTETNTEQFRKEQALLAWMKKNGGHHHRDRQPPSAAYLKDLRIHRHSLTYRGAMLNINRYRLRASSCPDIYRNSMTTIAKEKTAWYQGIDDFKNLFLDILDFSYFADIRFLLFAISNFLLYTWYDVPYVYLTDNAIEMGIEETDASMLIGIIGIVNMFGEIALGWIGDFKGISASVVYAVCMALCGAVTAMVPLSKSYTWLCSIAGLFGLFIAANYALTSIILVELITLERFTNAYGLLLMVQGIANLVGPPLAGWIYDVTGTYDLSFYIAGFFIAISGLMLFILPACGKYRKYRALRRQTLTDQSETPKISSIGTSTNETPSTKSNGTTILGDCFNKELIKETVRADHV